MEEDHCILVHNVDDDDDDDIFEDDIAASARPGDDNCLNIVYLSSIIAAIGKTIVFYSYSFLNFDVSSLLLLHFAPGKMNKFELNSHISSHYLLCTTLSIDRRAPLWLRCGRYFGGQSPGCSRDALDLWPGRTAG